MSAGIGADRDDSTTLALPLPTPTIADGSDAGDTTGRPGPIVGGYHRRHHSVVVTGTDMHQASHASLPESEEIALRPDEYVPNHTFFSQIQLFFEFLIFFFDLFFFTDVKH
jgi:hypothetical protein